MPLSIPATVRETVYLGANARVVAEVAGRHIIWADLRDAEAAVLEAGSEVGLAATPQAATNWEKTT